MIFYIVSYIICAVLSYGLSLDYWQNNPKWRCIRNAHYREDVMISAFFALAGPLNLIATLIVIAGDEMLPGFLFWRKGAWARK